MRSKKKIKIEWEDSQGSKYNLSLEGNLANEKIIQAMEFMDLVRSDQSFDNSNINLQSRTKGPLSVDFKIWNIIEQSFPNTTFTSSDIVRIYAKKYDELIKLSIISTYLARYYGKGKLIRTKRLREYVYSMPVQTPVDDIPSTETISTLTNNKTINDLQN